ncbi:MAG: DMT family transporter [Acidimicrobiia bacterium]
MEVLLGGITSILYGVADFLGGEAARKVNAATVVVWSGVFSFPVLLVVVAFTGGDATGADYLIGFAAGVSGAIGLVMLFTGLARGRAATVAPIAAALGAVVPVVVAVLAGDRPSLLAWAGVGIAIPAIALSAWTDEGEGKTRSGLAFGAIAGLGFGGFAAIIGFTGDDSGILPLLTARGGLLVALVVLAGFGVWKLQGFSKTPRGIILGNSVMDISANITLIYALRAGSFALAAVAASFYPAATVILAKLVNGESLRARQILGIVMTLVALGLIAAN